MKAYPQLKETIQLANGLTLEAWDLSKHTAGDRCQVVLGCRLTFSLRREYFSSDSQGEIAYNSLRSEVGPTISYEFLDQRNFVPRVNADSVWQELFQHFKEDSLFYLSHPEFARKFSLSTYMRFKKDPYKFRLDIMNSPFRQLEEKKSSPTLPLQ